MSVQGHLLHKTFATLQADERFLTRVNPLVVEKDYLSRKTLSTHGTGKGALPCVATLVYTEGSLKAEAFAALLALKGLLARV